MKSLIFLERMEDITCGIRNLFNETKTDMNYPIIYNEHVIVVSGELMLNLVKTDFLTFFGQGGNYGTRTFHSL